MKTIIAILLLSISFLLSSFPTFADSYPKLLDLMYFQVAGENWRTPTPVDILVSGRYVFVLSDRVDPAPSTQSVLSNNINRQLLVTDVADKKNIKFMGYSPPTFAEYPFSFTKVGRYIYTGSPCCYGSLVVFDVQNPANIPATVYNSGGGYNIGEMITNDGKYVYFRNGGSIFTVSTDVPSNPKVVATIPSIAHYFAISGKYIYNVDTTGKLHIIDNTLPTSPELVQSQSIGVSGAGPIAVKASNNYLYVLFGSMKKLYILDISDPLKPKVTGTVSFDGTPIDMTVQGQFAYVITQYKFRMFVVDNTNPKKPFVASSAVVSKDGLSGFVSQSGLGPIVGSPSGIAVSGRYAYVTSRNGLLEAFYLGKYTDYTNKVTIDMPKEAPQNTNYKIISITAETSLLNRESGAKYDNQIQLYLKDGRHATLKYEKVVNNKTIWKGSLKQPKKIKNSGFKFAGSLEQITPYTVGAEKTHFSSLPPGFTNDGIRLDFEIKNATPGSYIISSEPGVENDITKIVYISPPQKPSNTNNIIATFIKKISDLTRFLKLF